MNGIVRTCLLAALAGWMTAGQSEAWAATKRPTAPAAKKHGVAQNPYLSAIVVDAATGNVLFLFNPATGQIVAQNTYSAFGQVLNSNNALSICPLAYQGRYTDVETGLIFYAIGCRFDYR